MTMVIVIETNKTVIYDIADQYDKISLEFDHTRVRIWSNVKNFISDTDKSKKKLLDAGCGNGKNSLYAKLFNYDTTGIDISNKLLDISKSKGLNVYYKNILELNSFDFFDKCICIAVIHHFQSIELQCDAIIQMIGCLNNNGELLISVWSYEKNNIFNINESNIDKYYRDFTIGHNYIEWKLRDTLESIKRFYFIHDYNSFKSLIEMVNNIVKIDYEISWEKQNWFCKIKKVI